MRIKTRTIVQAAVVAALYTALTLLVEPYAYGPIQFRISEALTVLPAILPSSIPGLVIGCLLSNFLGGYGMADIVFGTIATLLAGISTWYLRKHTFLVPLPPVVFNGLIVGTYIYLLYDKTYSWPLTMLFIAIAEAVICYGLGIPLLTLLKKNRAIREALHISID
jgi:QueT transporter.